jgi:hypothetical protein
VLFVSCAGSNQFPVVANSGSIGNIAFNNSNMNAGQAAPEKSPALELPADTAETMYFQGISAPKRTQQEAYNDSMDNARIQVAKYIYVQVEEKVEDASTYKKSMGKVDENTEIATIASSSYTREALHEVKLFGKPQIATFRNGTVEAQIVVAVDKKLLDKAIDDFNRKRDAVSTVRFTGGAFIFNVPGLKPPPLGGKL